MVKIFHSFFLNASHSDFILLLKKATQSCSSQRETAHLAMLSRNAQNTLKSVVEINPKVLQDASAIFNEFPCNYWIAGPFARFVSKST